MSAFNLKVIAWIGVASEVAVGVVSVENCKADPAEILLTGNAGHLVAAQVFLKKQNPEKLGHFVTCNKISNL